MDNTYQPSQWNHPIPYAPDLKENLNTVITAEMFEYLMKRVVSHDPIQKQLDYVAVLNMIPKYKEIFSHLVEGYSLPTIGELAYVITRFPSAYKYELPESPFCSVFISDARSVCETNSALAWSILWWSMGNKTNAGLMLLIAKVEKAGLGFDSSAGWLIAGIKDTDMIVHAVNNDLDIDIVLALIDKAT